MKIYIKYKSDCLRKSFFVEAYDEVNKRLKKLNEILFIHSKLIDIFDFYISTNNLLIKNDIFKELGLDEELIDIYDHYLKQLNNGYEKARHVFQFIHDDISRLQSQVEKELLENRLSFYLEPLESVPDYRGNYDLNEDFPYFEINSEEYKEVLFFDKDQFLDFIRPKKDVVLHFSLGKSYTKDNNVLNNSNFFKEIEKIDFSDVIIFSER